MMRKSLVLIAHGSRLEAANHEVRSLAKRLEEKLGFPVIPAFLELATPNIPEGVDLALKLNVLEVLVFPYFLTQGRHVTEDIPHLLQKKREEHPNITIQLLPYLGTHEELVNLIAEIIG